MIVTQIFCAARTELTLWLVNFGIHRRRVWPKQNFFYAMIGVSQLGGPNHLPTGNTLTTGVLSYILLTWVGPLEPFLVNWIPSWMRPTFTNSLWTVAPQDWSNFVFYQIKTVHAPVHAWPVYCPKSKYPAQIILTTTRVPTNSSYELLLLGKASSTPFWS